MKCDISKLPKSIFDKNKLMTASIEGSCEGAYSLA